MTARGQALTGHAYGATDDGERVADEADVLRRLRTDTAAAHRAVEDALDLMDPGLTRARLIRVLTRLHGFWVAAEAGLEAWAVADPATAAGLDWSRRRRAHLYAEDLAALGATPAVPVSRPVLPAVTGTDAALGRLYVLEGSTLGGVFIDRHLATLPSLAGTRGLRAFSPYGADTGAMWHAYRSATRAHVAAGGDPGALVEAARQTFAALARWCGAPLAEPIGGPARRPSRGASQRSGIPA
jgi:heme oxygenase